MGANKINKRVLKALVSVFLFLLLTSCNNISKNEDSETNNETSNTTDTIIQSQENNQESNVQSELAINIEVGDYLLTATLIDNSTTQALLQLLSKSPITIDMRDYRNMEKVGALPENLPRNDEAIDTDFGDLIIYQGNSFVIYYDTNSWNLQE